MRKSVRIFADQMEARLLEKEGEYGEQSWLDEDSTVEMLHNRLFEMLDKIEDAKADCNNADIRRGYVDVANFAMMITDRIRGRK